MADQNINPVGCLGRLLTIFGVIWIGIVILGSIGLLAEFGLSGGILAWVSGTIIPALLLLVAGRALRRRARTMEEPPALPTTPTPPPGAPGRRVPTSRPGQPRPILTPPRLPGETSPRTPAPPPARPTPETTSPVPERKPPPPVEPISRPSGEPIPSLEDVIPARPERPPATEKPAAAARALEDLTPSPPKTSRQMIEEARRRWGRKE